MTVKDRLIEFIRSKKISTRKFESLCGLSYGYVNNIRVSIQPNKISSIAAHFPDLNTGWLLTGEGEMLKKEASYTSSEKVGVLQEPEVQSLELLLKTNNIIATTNAALVENNSRLIEINAQIMQQQKEITETLEKISKRLEKTPQSNDVAQTA